MIAPNSKESWSSFQPVEPTGRRVELQLEEREDQVFNAIIEKNWVI
jgi:hypothetical protein